MRARVTENCWPAPSGAWSVFMPIPKRMRSTRSSRGVSEANTRVVVSRRLGWIAAASIRSANRSHSPWVTCWPSDAARGKPCDLVCRITTSPAPRRCRHRLMSGLQIRRRTRRGASRRWRGAAPRRRRRERSLSQASPLTMKLAPGSAWNTVASVGSVIQSCAQARRPRSVSTAVGLTSATWSKRAPTSLRVSVAVRPRCECSAPPTGVSAQLVALMATKAKCPCENRMLLNEPTAGLVGKM
jgi:hypothetical protein